MVKGYQQNVQICDSPLLYPWWNAKFKYKIWTVSFIRPVLPGLSCMCLHSLQIQSQDYSAESSPSKPSWIATSSVAVHLLARYFETYTHHHKAVAWVSRFVSAWHQSGSGLCKEGEEAEGGGWKTTRLIVERGRQSGIPEVTRTQTRAHSLSLRKSHNTCIPACHASNMHTNRERKNRHRVRAKSNKAVHWN